MEKFMFVSNGVLVCAHVGRDKQIKDVRPMEVRWHSADEVEIHWSAGIYKKPARVPITNLEMEIRNDFDVSLDVSRVEFTIDGETISYTPDRRILVSGHRSVASLAKKYPVAAAALEQWANGEELRNLKRAIWHAENAEQRRAEEKEKREIKEAFNKAVDRFVRRELKNNEKQVMQAFMGSGGLKKAPKAHFIVGVQAQRGLDLFEELKKKGFMQ